MDKQYENMKVNLSVYVYLQQLKPNKMSNEHAIRAYCMKTKEKNVIMLDAVITKTARGGYMAQGNDGKGNKMTTMLSEATANQAVKAGLAKMG